MADDPDDSYDHICMECGGKPEIKITIERGSATIDTNVPAGALANTLVLLAMSLPKLTVRSRYPSNQTIN